tara:strand:+ start:157 stop:327 length:171 start_codon:yes stop_codon:yes gene_type:complete
MRKTIWLFLSSFGIMFAVLSWAQESEILDNEMGPFKGLLAVLLGAFLYFGLARYID